MNANRANFFTRNPEFLKLWSGQILSQSCGRMYQIAMVWWVLSTYGSGKYVGLFMVMAALPSLLFVKRVGRLVDKVLSRNILVIADILAALVLVVASIFLEVGHIPVVLLFGFVSATLQAFIDPTLNKAVAEVVTPEDVEHASGVLSSTQSIASFTGAMFGALLIDSLGIRGTILLGSSGYLISSFLSALTRFAPVKHAAENGASGEGLSLLDPYPLLKKILLGFALVNFFATPTLVVLPIYVKTVLGATAQTLGILEGGLWMGLILGAVFAKYVLCVENRLKLASFCLLVFGSMLLVPGVIVFTPLFFIALFIAGFFLGLLNAKFMAYFQETVAPEIKGRFFALMQAMLGSTFPIAYFLFGFLTDILAVETVCLIQGSGVILLSLYFMRLGGADVERRSLSIG
jgi:MFS family permease